MVMMQMYYFLVGIPSNHVRQPCPQAIVSVERINKFLERDELDEGVVQQDASMECMLRQDIYHNSDTPVTRYFNKYLRHSPAKFEGLSLSILSFICAVPNIKAGQSERDMEEKRWIYRLSSFVPRGLNLLRLLRLSFTVTKHIGFP